MSDSAEIDRTIMRIKNARRKARQIIDDPNSSDDQIEEAELALSSINDLIDGMIQYTNSVFRHQFTSAMNRIILANCNEREDYIKTMEDADSGRIAAHDVLLIDVKVADFECECLGVEPICGMLPEEYKKDVSGLCGKANRKKDGVVPIRHGIAKWGWNFVLGCTVALSLGRDTIDMDNHNEVVEASELFRPGSAKKDIERFISIGDE